MEKVHEANIALSVVTAPCSPGHEDAEECQFCRLLGVGCTQELGLLLLLAPAHISWVIWGKWLRGPSLWILGDRACN